VLSGASAAGRALADALAADPARAAWQRFGFRLLS
jgi:hypothetical protein